MAQYPNAIYTPRTMANRPGVVYDAAKTKVIFAEDFNKDRDEIVAIENALGVNLKNIDYLGWKQLLTIPTRQSSDDPNYVLRFNANMTGFLAPAQRIRFTQHGAVKYFIIQSVGAYSGGNTDVVVYGGTDYDVEDTGTYAITLPYFSMQKAPFGFPMDPTKWTVQTLYTSDTAQGSPTADVVYNIGGVSISIPIGCWKVSIQNSVMSAHDSALTIYAKTGLSTANNSFSDTELVGYIRAYNLNQIGGQIYREKILTLSAKTTYYLNETGNGTASLMIFGNTAKTIIRAVNAYL
jgi:hypothetical protein